MKDTSFSQSALDSSDDLDDSQDEAWWQFSPTMWLLIVGLILSNVGCFLSPSMWDNLLDVRKYPWWYFWGLVGIPIFAVRWYFFYQTYLDDDFDEGSWEEARRFCHLSGTLTAIFAVLVFLHQFFRVSTLYYAYYSLGSWFRLGHGAFSFAALLTLTIILAMIGLIVYLFGKWITAIQYGDD
ncbi:hypothetical protein FACS189443_5570 [Planctomycetales bacterium]|nr:hypothetical protein FACS189443_5570 [Planctomycetales bacterium]